MGINSLVRSKGFKNFMAKLYGWGAALVIMGALFKINGYKGASVMLAVGLGTEAIIFFFSAFEPPHVEPDWSLVYPELAGMYSEDPEFSLTASASQELDTMLENAKIGPELIESLGVGLRSLSETTSSLSKVSDASLATNEYIDSVKSASQTAGELSENYKKTSEALTGDVNASQEYVQSIRKASASASNLSESYIQTSQNLKNELSANEDYIKGIKAATESAHTLADKYTQSAESLVKSAQAIDLSGVDGDAYSEQLQKIAKNLSALNSVYELQLGSSTQQAETTAKLEEGMNVFIENLNESIENTAKYKEQAAVLASNVAALNNVYGNMLTAMNVQRD
ncbi:MAG: gliding motility protein GldL [Bacteroidetes bacterium]|nr:gliding motility protein GldL [Bacteroidota bacterium]